jgi:hypothetical protein
VKEEITAEYLKEEFSAFYYEINNIADFSIVLEKIVEDFRLSSSL